MVMEAIYRKINDWVRKSIPNFEQTEHYDI